MVDLLNKKFLEVDDGEMDEDPPHVAMLEKFFEHELPLAAALDRSPVLAKSEGWDTPIATSTVSASAVLEKRATQRTFVADSDARFEATCARIRKLFAGHDDEAETAISLGRELRHLVRAAALVASTEKPAA